MLNFKTYYPSHEDETNPIEGEKMKKNSQIKKCQGIKLGKNTIKNIKKIKRIRTKFDLKIKLK